MARCDPSTARSPYQAAGYWLGWYNNGVSWFVLHLQKNWEHIVMKMGRECTNLVFTAAVSWPIQSTV
jgi:hypothetical protein